MQRKINVRFAHTWMALSRRNALANALSPCMRPRHLPLGDAEALDVPDRCARLGCGSGGAGGGGAWARCDMASSGGFFPGTSICEQPS